MQSRQSVQRSCRSNLNYCVPAESLVEGQELAGSLEYNGKVVRLAVRA